MKVLLKGSVNLRGLGKMLKDYGNYELDFRW